MKVLERHENNTEEYTICTCHNCGSKLDVLKSDCELDDTGIFDYIGECPVCTEELHFKDSDFHRRPKPKVKMLEGEELNDFLKMKMSKIDSSSNKGEVTAFSFTPSPELIKWTDDHIEAGCHSHATAGEHFQYEFVPTGIVECQTVKCLVCGAKKTVYVD